MLQSSRSPSCDVAPEGSPSTPFGDTEATPPTRILDSSVDSGSACYALPIDAAEKIRRDYVRFGDARRPEDATHVRLETFDGPLALLLALIEQRQLDILSVRLGDLAGAYLDALARIERGRLPFQHAGQRGGV